MNDVRATRPAPILRPNIGQPGVTPPRAQIPSPSGMNTGEIGMPWQQTFVTPAAPAVQQNWNRETDPI